MSRACTCPPDGSAYCPRCTALLTRAVGVQVPTLGSRPLQESSREETMNKQPPAQCVPRNTVDAAFLEQACRFRSQTELRYARLLANRQLVGEIAAWWYEPCKGLYLAPATSYTPDFLVWTPTGGLEFHEVKGGFIRAKDWQKTKWAASIYRCFVFVLAQWKSKAWHYKTVPTG